jgi:hypothetical protein
MGESLKGRVVSKWEEFIRNGKNAKCKPFIHRGIKREKMELGVNTRKKGHHMGDLLWLLVRVV